ncbi:MAG: dihydropteroate synthase [Planctomycetota bacterium]|nr:MAG: dihydropteroate synthase [Planctomycetota bacterium]
MPPAGATRVMAVLNLTPDSFSDGGRFASPAQAVAAGRAAVQAGAELLDLGAVSTRPGSRPPPPDEEWARLEPVLGPLRAAVSVPLSLDTTRAAVLERALELGVDLLNDTSALADDPDLGPLAAQAGLPVVLMHRRGTPADMQDAPRYHDCLAEVLAGLREAVARAEAAGIAAERLLLDPGIGFGKRLEHNLALLAGLPALVALGHRTLLGCSRKAFLGAVTGAEVQDREHGTTVTTVLAAQAGVDFVRVHDPAAARQALDLLAAVEGARGAR